MNRGMRNPGDTDWLTAGPQLRGWLRRFLLAPMLIGISAAAAQSLDPTLPNLDREVQALRAEVLAIHRELLFLEEELQYPERSRILVYVSTAPELDLTLQSVELKLDGESVAHQYYGPADVQSLREGGAHRLYIGILPRGDHVLSAAVDALGPTGADAGSGAAVKFRKSQGPKYIELRLEPPERGRELAVTINQW